MNFSGTSHDTLFASSSLCSVQTSVTQIDIGGFFIREAECACRTLRCTVIYERNGIKIMLYKYSDVKAIANTTMTQVGFGSEFRTDGVIEGLQLARHLTPVSFHVSFPGVLFARRRSGWWRTWSMIRPTSRYVRVPFECREKAAPGHVRTHCGALTSTTR